MVHGGSGGEEHRWKGHPVRMDDTEITGMVYKCKINTVGVRGTRVFEGKRGRRVRELE